MVLRSFAKAAEQWQEKKPGEGSAGDQRGPTQPLSASPATPHAGGAHYKPTLEPTPEAEHSRGGALSGATSPVVSPAMVAGLRPVGSGDGPLSPAVAPSVGSGGSELTSPGGDGLLSPGMEARSLGAGGGSGFMSPGVGYAGGDLYSPGAGSVGARGELLSPGAKSAVTEMIDDDYPEEERQESGEGAHAEEEAGVVEEGVLEQGRGGGGSAPTYEPAVQSAQEEKEGWQRLEPEGASEGVTGGEGAGQEQQQGRDVQPLSPTAGAAPPPPLQPPAGAAPPLTPQQQAAAAAAAAAVAALPQQQPQQSEGGLLDLADEVARLASAFAGGADGGGPARSLSSLSSLESIESLSDNTGRVFAHALRYFIY